MPIPVVSDMMKGSDSAFSAGGGSALDPWTYVALGSDSSNSTVTLADTGTLAFTADANTDYEVELLGWFTSAATTTGIAFALIAPTGATVVGFGLHSLTTATPAMIAQNVRTGPTGVSTGVPSAATNTAIQGKWLVKVTTAGTVKLQHRSEIAASAVVMMTGTILKYRKAAQVGVGAATLMSVVQLTQAAYDAITTPDPNTMYLIKG